MKFKDAVKLLINKEAKYIESPKAGAYRQNLSSLKFWLFHPSHSMGRGTSWELFLKHTDWRIDNVKYVTKGAKK